MTNPVEQEQAYVDVLFDHLRAEVESARAKLAAVQALSLIHI